MKIVHEGESTGQGFNIGWNIKNLWIRIIFNSINLESLILSQIYIRLRTKHRPFFTYQKKQINLLDNYIFLNNLIILTREQFLDAQKNIKQ